MKKLSIKNDITSDTKALAINQTDTKLTVETSSILRITTIVPNF